jgi:hypothetical protein
MKTQNKRPHTFFDEDPASTWCYHHKAYIGVLDIPRACNAFQTIAKQELAKEYAWISDSGIDGDYEDSFTLKKLKAYELMSLCRMTALALGRPGFRRVCLPMEELLYRCIDRSLRDYLAGLSTSKLWPAIIKGLGCGDDPYWVLNDLFWDYDWQLFDQTPEEAKALAEDLKALW